MKGNLVCFKIEIHLLHSLDGIDRFDILSSLMFGRNYIGTEWIPFIGR